MKKLHRLLERQLRKYLPEYSVFPGGIESFIDAVHQSYEHFESNHQLIERAMRLSSDELSEFNQKLQQESKRQQLILLSLREAIKQVSPGEKIVDDDDLLRITDVLKEEIEKRKQLETDLRKARRQAETSLETRKQFLANVSHEIRTPINAVVGMSGLLEETDLSSMQREYLEAIRSSAESLMVIINDLLDMSKLESGKVTLELRDFSMSDLVQQLYRSMWLKAEEKGIKLELKTDGKLAPWLVGDTTRIRQVMINLLSNAIKFTNHGSVVMKIQVVKNLKDSQSVRLAVADTGIGISKSRLQTIFEQFMQEDVSVTRKYGGTGLGLTISKQLVAMMDGQLEVLSTKGVGSEFSFTINLPKGKKPLAENKRQNDFDLHGAHILVVDDNEINRYLTITLLKRWNGRADSAPDGLHALEKIRTASSGKSKPYDAVLMDLQMPEMDGFETTKIIRQQLKLDVPVLAITANALDSERERCVEIGMNDYITKPFRPEEVFEKIIKHMVARTPVPKAKNTARFSLERLQTLYKGNNEHLNKTVQVFIRQSEKDMNTMMQKLERRDYEAIMNLAHKMKPNIELFGIVELAGVVMEIESCAEERNRKKILPLIEKLRDVTREVARDLREAIME